MSVDQPQVIDVVSKDKKGSIVLTISDQSQLKGALQAESKDPALVRDTMGHEDLKTTMEYMHPT